MAFQIILIDLNGKLQATKIHNNANDRCACCWWRCWCGAAFLREIWRNAPNAIFKNTRKERTNKRANPICLMNHFSVFNTNFMVALSLAFSSLHVSASTFGWLSIISTVPSPPNPFMWNKKFEHATVLYTLCVVPRESHFNFSATQCNGKCVRV